MCIKKTTIGFAILAVYVDDLNLIGSPEELINTANDLKNEFEMKDLGKIKYCLGLKIECCSNDVFICHTLNSTGVIYVTILPPDFFFHNLSLNSTWSNHLET